MQKVFIPISRSDEIYCDRIFKNNKTCKQLGYTEKARDEYQKANDINGFQKWLDEHKNSF